MMLKTKSSRLGIGVLGLMLAGYLWGTPMTMAQEKTILAGQIVDHDIFDQQGQQIGEIDDLIIKRNGKVKKITVEIGGFLGLGDKLIAVSPDYMKIRGPGDVSITATHEQLKQKSAFDYYRQGLAPDYRTYRPRPYLGPYDRPFPPSRRHGYFYGRPPYYEGPYRYGYGTPYPEMYTNPIEMAQSPRQYLASVIMGRDVLNYDGTNIGVLEDLAIGADDKVEKIILSVMAADMEKVVALPYESPSFTFYGVVYDISLDELRNLPPYR